MLAPTLGRRGRRQFGNEEIDFVDRIVIGCTARLNVTKALRVLVLEGNLGSFEEKLCLYIVFDLKILVHFRQVTDRLFSVAKLQACVNEWLKENNWELRNIEGTTKLNF